jgi:hypothetical protein
VALLVVAVVAVASAVYVWTHRETVGATGQVAVAAADSTYVAENRPTASFAGTSTIEASSRSNASAIAYVRFVVPEHAGTHLTSAQLILTTATHAIGMLELHTVSSNQWRARDISYAKRPAIYGALARAPGPTSNGSQVTFNLSELITTPGVYSFAITSASTTATFAAYASHHRLGPRLMLNYARGKTTSRAVQAAAPGGPIGAIGPGVGGLGPSAVPSPGTVSQGVSTLPGGATASGLPTSTTTAVTGPAPTTQPTKAPAPPPAPPGNPGNPVIPSGPTICGATFQVNSGQSYLSGLAAEQGRVGTLKSARVFNTGGPQSWPGNAGSLNRTVIVSFKYLPSQILSGSEDSTLRSWFNNAPRNEDVYWSYYHEPEDQIADGTFSASDYKAAWRHLAALADQANNSHLHATLILMSWSLMSQSGRNWKDYYPGDDVIDVLGWDVYNLGNEKGTYTSAASLLNPVVAASKSVGKPWGVAEMGAKLASGDSGSTRAAWITSMVSMMRSNHALWAEYFDLDKSNAGRYDWRLRDSASENAWANFCRS